MKRGLKRALLWGPFGVLLLSLAFVYFLFNTSLAERIARHSLDKALAKTGGTLTVASREGSLARGLTLDGVELRIPPRLHLTARRVHLRLSKAALLSGTLLLKDLSITEPVVEIVVPKRDGARTAPKAPPSWLRVSAPELIVTGGRVVLRREGRSEDDQVWSQVNLKADASWFVQHLSAKIESLEVSPPPSAPYPLPNPLRASGTVSLDPSRDVRFDLAATSPRSSAKVRGAYLFGDKAPAYHASLSLAGVSLQEVAVGWKGPPDLTLKGTAKVEGDAQGLRYEIDARAEGLGPFVSKGKIAFVGGGLDLSGDARTTGALLAPFWHAPKGREAKVAGSGTWSVRVRGKEASWQASADLGPSSVWGIPVLSGKVSGSGGLQGADLSAQWVSPLTGPAKGSFRIERPSRGWKAEASASAVELFSLLHDLGVTIPFPSWVRPPKGPWDIGHFSADGSDHRLALQGSGVDPQGCKWTFALDPMGERFAGFSLGFEGLNPSAWGLLSERHGSLSGTAKVGVASGGDGALKLDLSAIRWAGLEARPLSATLQFAEGQVTLAPLLLDTDAGNARISGIFHSDGRVEAPIDLDVPDLVRLRPLLGESVPPGALAASVRVSGLLRELRIEGEASLAGSRLGDLAVARLEARGHWDSAGAGSDLDLAWSAASYAGQPFGAGKAHLSGKAQAMEARLDTELGSGRNLSLKAAGMLAPPLFDLRFDEVRLEALDRKFIQEGSARAVLSKEALTLSGLTLVKNKSRLTLAGRLDLVGLGPGGFMSSAPLAATFTATHFPLALLPIPPTAGTISGFIDAGLNWSGRINKPVLSGRAEVKEGLYRYAQSDRVITPITAKFEAEGDRLVLREARATTPEGGEATAEGYARFVGLWPAQFELKAHGTDFPFVFGKDIDGVAAFDMTLKGSPAAPTLDGRVRVKKGRIQLPELERRKALPETVRFVNAPPGSPYASPPESSPSLVSTVRGSVLLESSGGLWVSSKNLLAEVTGGVTARFTANGPTIEGGLDILSGRFLFQGRKFEIHDSRVSFDGTTDLRPYLSVNALYRIQDTEIDVHLTGRASKPELRLTSSPPLDEADILSLLIVGHTAKDAGTRDSQAVSASAAGAVALYGAAPILDAARDALGLDSMSVSAGTNPQMAFAKSLGDKTVLEYQQSFGALPEWWVNLRYKFNRSTSVQTSSSSKGNTGIDLFWERRY